MAAVGIVDGPDRAGRDQSVALALAVILDRVRELPAADRDDFMSLVADLRAAETQDEKDAITNVMCELLGGTPRGVHAATLVSSHSKPQGYKRWVRFVSKRVRVARVMAKLTQDQLAAKTGLPQSHISRIENARLSPSHATLEKIAMALGLATDHFGLC